MHIGPEPTTDKFMALFHDGADKKSNSSNDLTNTSGFHKKRNDNDSTAADTITDDIRVSGRLMKGNTLTVTPKLPFFVIITIWIGILESLCWIFE